MALASPRPLISETRGRSFPYRVRLFLSYRYSVFPYLVYLRYQDKRGPYLIVTSKGLLSKTASASCSVTAVSVVSLQSNDFQKLASCFHSVPFDSTFLAHFLRSI